MKALIIVASMLSLCAQQPPAPEVKAESPGPAAKQPAPEVKTESPVPAAESRFTGSIDLGYRWRAGLSGNSDTYRSVVNLGSGPKLLGAAFEFNDPKSAFLEQMHVRASSWGDEPYATFHLDAKKAKLYDFRADYRNIAYYNVLPSYADPLLARGIILNERSFDMRRRFAGFDLDFLPGNWFIPYFAYDRDSGSGTGATTFVSEGNEYPLPNQLRDATSLYRGGVRFERRRFHATLEQGGTTFKDDQSIFQSPGPANYGNVLAPVLGQRLNLTSLLAGYGIRGTSIYTKGLFTAAVASSIDLYGQFLFSQPDSSTHYQQTAAGNLYLQNQVLFYSSQQYLLAASAKMPHTSGNFGAEIRPFARLRIVESILTDRLHEGGSASSNGIFAGVGGSQQIAALLASSLVTNYNQQSIDVFFDATSKLTLHGGYRYVWGDASDAVLPALGLSSSDRGNLRRHAGLGGATFRPTRKISITSEVESASSGSAYFRTSLYNYQKLRGQARYRATGTLSFAAGFNLLNNQNPQPAIRYDYLAHQVSLSMLLSPAGGKRWSLQGSYTRSAMHSDIGYLSPQDLQPQRSFYRDNAHTATALFDFNLPGTAHFAPKITAGGSFFLSSGSRPNSYYQPLAKLWLPLGKQVTWFSEWRYYGYGEAFFLYEGFRTHLVTTGLRLTR